MIKLVAIQHVFGNLSSPVWIMLSLQRPNIENCTDKMTLCRMYLDSFLQVNLFISRVEVYLYSGKRETIFRTNKAAQELW